MTFWALIAYIGIWHSLQDMVVGLIRWLFVPIKEPQQQDGRKKTSWRDTLYFGDRQMIYESRPLYGREERFACLGIRIPFWGAQAMPVVRKRLFVGIGVGGFLARPCRRSA